MPDQNVQSQYPFSDWKGTITLPFEAVDTYMAFKREFNPWGFLPLDLFQLQNITCKLWLPALLELRPLICLLQPILLGSLPPPPQLTHIPPAAYPSGLPTPPSPLISLLLPILLGSLPPLHSHPSCSLSFWAPYPPPPTHIPLAAYPSELPDPRPLPPMNALEESITETLQCP